MAGSAVKKIALVGYGNVGREVLEALKGARDMDVAGVVTLESCKEELLQKGLPCSVVTHVEELSHVDGAILAIPSREVPKTAPDYLARGIHTVDGFDIHGKPLMDMRRDFAALGEKHGAVGVISAGWDPGSDSVVRALLEVIAPRGITHTNFGPGMSMGHTVAVKALEGVRDALSETLPRGEGLHKRHVYVELDEGASFEQVREAILEDPYFSHDETHIFPVDCVENLVDRGHGVNIIRRGVSGNVHNQRMHFAMTLQNPAATAQVMVSAMRASFAMPFGAYTMLEIPLIHFLEGDREALLARLM